MIVTRELSLLIFYLPLNIFFKIYLLKVTQKQIDVIT